MSTSRSQRSDRSRPGIGSAVALAGLLLAAGAVALVALPDGPAAAPVARARGLHGSQLPAGIAGSRAVAFDLADGRGGRITSASLAGRPYALTFLYTHCPDVCPLIGHELVTALGMLGARARRVAVVGVSVDPAGDDAPAVRDWLAHLHAPANFHYAIGSERQLSPVWKAYYASPQIAGRPETSTHTAAVWLVDARGRLRASYSAGAAVRPDEIAGDLRTLLAQPGRGGASGRASS